MNPPPPNIRIQWLPLIDTSLYQPLNQGIINRLKLGYRRAWLQYMIQEYEEFRNPLQSMNLYLAVKWILDTWSEEISHGAIYGCFRKARILPGQEPINLPTVPLPNLSSLYRTVQSVSQIQDMMDINQFLNPDNESIEDSAHLCEPDLAEIIARHVGIQSNEDSDEMEGDEQAEIAIPTAEEALAGIKLYRRYKEHQADTTADEMKEIYRWQRTLEIELETEHW